jgi:hypothetical protein
MSANKQILFQLMAMATEEFATFEENLQDGEIDLKIQISSEFGIDAESRRVQTSVRFGYFNNEQPIIILEASCEFQVVPDSWEGFFNKGRTNLTLPKTLVQHLATITVGTTRGILHSKTENTPFNKYFIPLINVTEMFNENLKFDLN